MTIIININGNRNGEGFLIAPVGTKTFDVPVGLSTTDGTSINASLRATGGANVALDQTDITITPVEKFVNIHATSASTSRNDIVFQVMVGGVVNVGFNLTAIASPQIWFKGRFQARFATDMDFYNEKRGTSEGWNFALEGEPDFVPNDSVPTDINKPVGREVHFNNPVALRTHVPPIGVHVISIKGQAGPNTEEFFVGDPIIGQQVDLGPHTYLAANEPQNTPVDPPPAETYTPGFERMAIFEFHIANALSGKSHSPQDRPVANGIIPLAPEELTQYGIVNQSTFDNARKNVLLNDYKALSPADRTGTAAGRNLARRIANLGGDQSTGIARIPDGNGVGWAQKEEYRGLINDSLTFEPFKSSVLSYFAGFNSLNFFGRMLNYHSDEQCGQVHGAISIGHLPQIPAILGAIRPRQKSSPNDSQETSLK